jgi:predicted lipoprotein
MISLRQGGRPILWALAACLSSGACKPWTVRPIQDSAASGTRSDAPFDAAKYVDAIWDTKVVAAVNATAVDIGSLPATPVERTDTNRPDSRRVVLVIGTARVADVDLKSRVGLAYLDLPGVQTAKTAIQVGPVLRGTALRDALPFVRFSDFVNQIDFAAVSSELNARALRSAIGGLDPASLKGKTVSCSGAATIVGGAPVVEITPLSLRVEGAER